MTVQIAPIDKAQEQTILNEMAAHEDRMVQDSVKGRVRDSLDLVQLLSACEDPYLLAERIASGETQHHLAQVQRNLETALELENAREAIMVAAGEDERLSTVQDVQDIVDALDMEPARFAVRYLELEREVKLLREKRLMGVGR